MKKFPPVLVTLLLLIAFLLRAFGLSGIQFDSDFGRDSIFAWRILHEKPTLLGAQASVGGFYLGPLYFYVIAVIFGIFGPLPEMVMLFFATLNVLAAWVGWRLFNSRISPKAGIIFLLLFAFSPLLILASRGATHMPMLPFITILVVAMFTRGFEKNNVIDHIFAGLAFGLFLHVHFSALLLLPGYFLAIIIFGKGTLAERLKSLAIQLIAIIIMASPLIVFDIRHSFITSRAFWQYIHAAATGGTIRDAFPHWTAAKKLEGVTLYLGSTWWLRLLVILGTIIGFTKTLGLKRENKLIISLLFLTGSVILLLLLYPGYLFSYYLIIPGTLIILFAASVLSQWRFRFVILLVILVVTFNLNNLWQAYSSQFRTITNLSRITAAIEAHVQAIGSPAFAIFKDSGDGLTGLAYEYRFLLTRDGFIPVSEYDYGLAKVLYIIREEGTNDPLKLSNFEVSQFAPRHSHLLTTLKLSRKDIDIFVLTRQ